MSIIYLYNVNKCARFALFLYLVFFLYICFHMLAHSLQQPNNNNNQLCVIINGVLHSFLLWNLFSANIKSLTKKNEVVFPKPLSSFIYIMYQLFASCYILFITSFYASQLSIQTILCSSLFHFHLLCEYRLDYNIKIEFLLSVKSNDSEYYTICVGGEGRLVLIWIW